MKNTLHAIQILSKVGKAASKVSMIFCIIGAAFSLLCLTTLIFGLEQTIKIGDITIIGLIENETGISENQIFLECIRNIIMFAAFSVVSGFANSYFGRELDAGTPFTHSGAKEMFRLGIITTSVPLVAAYISSIICTVVSKAQGFEFNPQLQFVSLVGIGIVLIALSYILKYGIEIQEKCDSSAETEQTAEKANL